MVTRRIWLILIVLGSVLLAVRGRAAPASPPMPDAFLISESFDYGFSPGVAYNAVSDEYLVVWGMPYDILARRFSSRGELLGSVVAVATGSDREAWPAVAYDCTNDRYLVVRSGEVATDNWDVCDRFIAWDGNLAAGEFAIDASTVDASYSPRVAEAHAQGDYVVVWEDYAYGGGGPQYVVRGRRLMARRVHHREPCLRESPQPRCRVQPGDGRGLSERRRRTELDAHLVRRQPSALHLGRSAQLGPALRLDRHL